MPVRQLPQEVVQTAERRQTVERNVPLDALFMAYHMCSREDADYYAFDILSDILSNGRSSRLTRRLVQEQKLFSSLDAYISGTRDAGLLHISGKPSAGVSLEQAEAAVRKELEELKSGFVGEQELEKVKNKFESTQIFGNINYLNVATNLAWFELTGQAEDIDREVDNYRSVTAEQLHRVAQQTFRDENGIVLYYQKKTFSMKIYLIRISSTTKHCFSWGCPLWWGSWESLCLVCRYADDWASQHGRAGCRFFRKQSVYSLYYFSTGFSYGLTPVVGGFYGNRRFAEAGQALRCSLVANVLVALLLTLVMAVLYFNVERLGQPGELLPLIKPYYLVLLASLVFVMLFNGFKQFTDGITDTKTAMWILLGGNALNIVGNYILINGKLGFPEMGLLGAGISTLFSRIVMVVVFAAIVLRGRRFIRYRLGFMRLGWSMPMFRKLNALGWPVGMQMGMETASFSLSVVMVGWLGTLALASHQIMLTISQFTFMMYYGMGAAVAVRVSNFKGQGDGQNVRRSAYAGLHIILCMEVVLLGIVFALRGQVGGWFTDNAEVSGMVAALFFPFLIYQFGDGLQINFANALRGISDVKPMMIIAFISYFIISLPVGYLCGFVFGWGLTGVWMAFPFGLTSAGVMLWLRFRKQTRERI